MMGPTSIAYSAHQTSTPLWDQKEITQQSSTSGIMPKSSEMNGQPSVAHVSQTRETEWNVS